eukprot:TRINITY_DN1771_c0_g1_i1.p1 TRINITY_DN1771_c0_g1~~TRINITY_DN1771_c0_g1_i1.p1  ORF type:complete len:512 (+),score=159.95 TRINITY_DN1771_c0_g1_i1:64-1599(+)
MQHIQRNARSILANSRCCALQSSSYNYAFHPTASSTYLRTTCITPRSTSSFISSFSHVRFFSTSPSPSPSSSSDKHQDKNIDVTKNQSSESTTNNLSSTPNTSTSFNQQQQQEQQQQNHQSDQGQSKTKKKRGATRKIIYAMTGAGIIYVTTAAIGFMMAQPESGKITFPGAILLQLPFRFTSNMWGHISHVELPVWLRSPIYGAYASAFGANLDEMAKPLEEYKSLAEFFARPLKPEARTWAKDGLASPVDGKVFYMGCIDNHTMEQVKGVTYTLQDFVGPDSPLVDLAKQIPPTKYTVEHSHPSPPSSTSTPIPPLPSPGPTATTVDSPVPSSPKDVPTSPSGTHLYHIAVYLAPGDYHGIHSPVDWEIERRRHIPGKLLPVAPLVVSRVPGVFSGNERVVLEGRWEHGLFSLTPVGASNVGSIVLPFDKDLVTNSFNRPSDLYYDRSFDKLPMKRGDQLAFFHMGSTIVMIFECPAGHTFKFNVEPGQTVRLGQQIGYLVKNEDNPKK